MGPALAPKACYRWSYIDPVLAPWNATYGFAWAQPWPDSVLPMVLCGPSTGPKACYLWYSMGPSLAPKHAMDGLAWSHRWPPKCATDDLAWAQHWPPSMLLMVLRGPSTCPNACE